MNFRQVGGGQGAFVLHPLHDDMTAKAQASLQLGDEITTVHEPVPPAVVQRVAQRITARI